MGAGVSAPGRDSRLEEARSRSWDSILVFAVPFMVVLAIALYRERRLFTTPIYPWGDAALNSLLVIRAEHFEQLVGNYSRVGFHHPGPAFFYVQAAGIFVFRDVLHVAAGAYNAQLLGITVYVSALVGLATSSVYRSTRSAGPAVLCFGLFFVFAARGGLFAGDWFPTLYISTFFVFIVAAGGLAAGRTAEFSLATFAGAMLIEGHVSFLMFVGVTSMLAAGAWYLVHRRGARAEMRRHRRALVGSGLLVVVFAVPMVAELVLHFPGPWSKYFHYIGSAKLAPRTFGQAVRFEYNYFSQAHFPPLLFGVAALVAVALILTEHDAARRRLYTRWYGACALETILVGYYLYHEVDALSNANTYVAQFYETVPLLLLVAAGGQLLERAAQRGRRHGPLRGRHYTASLPGRFPAGILAALSLAGGFTCLAVSGPSLSALPAAQSDMVAAVSAMRSDPGVSGRRIALVEANLSAWPETAGLSIALQRSGAAWCLKGTLPSDRVLFTDAYLCGAASGPLAVLSVSVTPPPKGAVTIWSGSLGNVSTCYVYSAA